MTKTFTKTERGFQYTADAYLKDGVWYWSSNDQVVPPDACPAYGIPADLGRQKTARERQTDEFITAYRANYQPPDEEQIAEMRAAFGPGQVVKNVITGHTTRT